jgi:peroxin-13
MVSVAEQFGNLRTTLGSILGIYTLLRWLRTIFAKFTGRPLPASAADLTPSAFASFEGRSAPPSPNAPPRPSKKPFLVFMLAVFGLPYLMGKLIRALAAGQEEQQKRLAESQPDSQPLDPSKLDFCIALYDFNPEPLGGAQGIDLQVKKGDLVAVLSKQDPMGNPSEWWRCRSRDGRVGYLPGNFLEAVKRKNEVRAITSGGPGSAEGSRISTMSSIGKAPEPEAVSVGNARPGELNVEAFQKSQFYS